MVLAAAPAEAALRYGNRITTAGLGPLEIGMTVSQAEVALGRELELQEVNPGCSQGNLSGRFNVFGLAAGDTIARIYVSSPAFATRKGVRVGTSERTLRRRYGRLVSFGREFYSREPQYTFRRGNRAIVFNTRRGRVAQISTGRYPEIRYVEGCA
jgi:hypothetical protein